MIKETFKKIKMHISNINSNYKSFISKKPLGYITQFFPKNILLLILFIIVLIMSINKIKSNDVEMISTSYTKFSDAIIEKSLTQEINTDRVNRFNKIGILFGTYGKVNTANYKFILYKNNKIINEKIINGKKIKDAQIYYFKYNTIKVRKNDNYKFSIVPINANKKNAIAVTIDEENNVYYELKANSEFNNFIIIYFIIALLLFMLINFLINNNYIKNGKSFYLLMLIYILPTLFLIPPLQSPDETNHFSRSYSISQYDFKKTPYKNTKKKIYSSKNISCLYYSKQKKDGFSDNVSRKNKMVDCFKGQKNTFNKTFYKINYSRFFTYFAPAIGIKIADIFTNSPMIIFYAGRLLNCVLSFFIILYALKKVKKHSSLILLIAMIPMFIYQMISYSYDSILNALCILVGALLINFVLDNKKIEKRDLILYSICTIIIFSIKVPYVLIPSLIVLVDGKKFSSKKYKKWLILLLIIISMLAFYKVVNYIPNIGKQDTTQLKVENINNSSDNLNQIINHPRYLLRVVKNTIELRGKWYFVTMIGSLGWLRYLFDGNIVIIYLLLLLSYILSHNSNILDNKKRLLGILMQLLLIGGIFLSIFITWTPFGYNYVEGVQGRYFLPILLPLILLLLPKKKIIDINDSFYMKAINIIQLYSIVMILVSFY